ncbi:hypothetical protein SAMN05444920_119157 [Nonomuraea solani]|uniref:FXSXX-COOH protein n=1 Tax=Nonomuraea solani TaxID=1144553 RepID=A0A1H6ETN0_9ACTN|nr:hypothetical protein [Nonomuraea solani]SEH01227.1 hypothetical protein SAMN05444920_119157 [Nonomuraea solani]
MQPQIVTRSRAFVDLSVISRTDLRELGDTAVPHALSELLEGGLEEEETFARFDNSTLPPQLDS